MNYAENFCVQRSLKLFWKRGNLAEVDVILKFFTAMKTWETNFHRIGHHFLQRNLRYSNENLIFFGTRIRALILYWVYLHASEQNVWIGRNDKPRGSHSNPRFLIQTLLGRTISSDNSFFFLSNLHKGALKRQSNMTEHAEANERRRASRYRLAVEGIENWEEKTRDFQTQLSYKEKNPQCLSHWLPLGRCRTCDERRFDTIFWVVKLHVKLVNALITVITE